MLRNLILISLLLLCAAGCRGKKASADEQRAAEGSAERVAAETARPAPLLPDAEHPPEPAAAEGSAVTPLAAPALDKSVQLRRPNLQLRPMTGAQGLSHELRAKTSAIRMHNSSIHPLIPKAIGAAAKPAAPAPR